jgi:hypothetical protein
MKDLVRAVKDLQGDDVAATAVTGLHALLLENTTVTRHSRCDAWFAVEG